MPYLWFIGYLLQSGNVSEIFGSRGREVEGEAGKKRREKSDDVIDFKATLREVNSLGVCVCVCVCVCVEGGGMFSVLAHW